MLSTSAAVGTWTCAKPWEPKLPIPIPMALSRFAFLSFSVEVDFPLPLGGLAALVPPSRRAVAAAPAGNQTAKQALNPAEFAIC